MEIDKLPERRGTLARSSVDGNSSRESHLLLGVMFPPLKIKITAVERHCQGATEPCERPLPMPFAWKGQPLHACFGCCLVLAVR